jgi:hypothetical protein
MLGQLESVRVDVRLREDCVHTNIIVERQPPQK